MKIHKLFKSEKKILLTVVILGEGPEQICETKNFIVNNGSELKSQIEFTCINEFGLKLDDFEIKKFQKECSLNHDIIFHAIELEP